MDRGTGGIDLMAGARHTQQGLSGLGSGLVGMAQSARDEESRQAELAIRQQQQDRLKAETGIAEQRLALEQEEADFRRLGRDATGKALAARADPAAMSAMASGETMFTPEQMAAMDPKVAEALLLDARSSRVYAQVDERRAAFEGGSGDNVVGVEGEESAFDTPNEMAWLPPEKAQEWSQVLDAARAEGPLKYMQAMDAVEQSYAAMRDQYAENQAASATHIERGTLLTEALGNMPEDTGKSTAKKDAMKAAMLHAAAGPNAEDTDELYAEAKIRADGHGAYVDEIRSRAEAEIDVLKRQAFAQQHAQQRAIRDEAPQGPEGAVAHRAAGAKPKPVPKGKRTAMAKMEQDDPQALAGAIQGLHAFRAQAAKPSLDSGKIDGKAYESMMVKKAQEFGLDVSSMADIAKYWEFEAPGSDVFDIQSAETGFTKYPRNLP